MWNICEEEGITSAFRRTLTYCDAPIVNHWTETITGETVNYDRPIETSNSIFGWVEIIIFKEGGVTRMVDSNQYNIYI